MKLLSSIVLCSFLACIVAAQTNELPGILIPSSDDQADAERLGARIFKILPRGMFEGPWNAYKDEENPLGIREGGAYYSFSTGSHSYNRIPQIGLEKGMFAAGGFYGANYGFMIDLGAIDLQDASIESEALRFLYDYVPPRLEVDIRKEQRKSHQYETGGVKFSGRLAAAEGHSYLLRAISFGEADKLVAFRVHRIESNGSAIIVYKTLKDYDTPILLHKSDERMTADLNSVLRDARYSNIEFEVKDNIVTLYGFVARGELSELFTMVNSTRPRGIVNKLRHDQKH